MVKYNNENSKNVMMVPYLIKILQAVSKETNDDYQIWLSSDEEGNHFSPMHKTMQNSIAIDAESKRVIFFPQH